MKHRAFFSSACALIACMVLLAGASVGAKRFSFSHRSMDGQRISSALKLASIQEDKKQEPKLSDGERQAAKKFQDAKGLEAQLQTGAEFVKKYPKSSLRPQIANVLAGQINNVQDRAQKISAAQTYLEFFNEPAEADAVQPVLIEAYLENNQLDESFSLASTWLARHPEEVGMLIRLAVAGSNEATRGNAKFLQPSQQYALKAIELMEADKKPESIEAAKWPQFKTQWLPALYRETGVFAMRANNKAEAKTRLEKAAALKSTDPSVYAILGTLADDEYADLVSKYKIAPAAEKDAAFKKAQEQMDKVIELYAQAIALALAKPEYKQIADQLTPSLESYYKYRHNGSTDGLQQLIDKYKQ